MFQVPTLLHAVPALRSICAAALVALTTLILAPQPADALTVAEEQGEYQLSLSFLGQAELNVQSSVEGGPVQYGPSVSLARVAGGASWDGIGSVAVQLGGASGDILLLDAVATLAPLEQLAFRIGKFRTGVSAEYQTGIANIPFVSRALITRLVPRRRTGAETEFNFGNDVYEVTGQVGLFQPATTTLANPQGQLFTARLLLSLTMGLNVHVGFAEHVFAENRLPTDPDERVLPLERPLDVAVFYKKDRLNLHAEGVAILDSPTPETIWSLYGHAAYRLGPDAQINAEPTLGYELVHQPEDFHRITAGTNIYWWDSGIVSTINYRLSAEEGNFGHAAFLQLQAGL